MKKSIGGGILLFIFASFIPLNAQWAKVYGDMFLGNAPPNCIQQCRDGGYIMVGSYLKSLWHNGMMGYWDAGYVIKVDPGGEIEWQYTYDSDGPDTFAYVQQTIDDGYIIAGWIWGRPIALKLDWQGKQQWAKEYRKGPAGLGYIQESTHGGYVAAGDGCILRLSYGGEIVWGLRYGSYKFRSGSFQQTREGGYITVYSESGLGGHFKVKKFTSSGTIEWQKSYSGTGEDLWPRSILQTADGGYFIVGDHNNYNDYVWILRLSSRGDINWQKEYSGFIGNIGLSALGTNDGGFLVACTSWDNSTLAIMRLFPNGGVKWFREYSSARVAYLRRAYYLSISKYAFQKTRDGGYIATAGYTEDGAKFVFLKLLSECEISPQCGYIKEYDVTGSHMQATALDTNDEPEILRNFSADTNIPLKDLDFYASSLCQATTTRTLEIQSTTGGISDPYPGNYIYYDGKEISIMAIPDGHNDFIGWEGDVLEDQINNNPLSLTLDSNKSIQANFLINKPRKPKRLKANAKSGSAIKLTWVDKSKNEDGFKIERRKNISEPWNQIAKVKANKRSYKDRGLEENTQYQYRVRAFNVSGYSSYSNIARAETKSK